MAHPFIEQLFKRVGVSNVTELNVDEKATYEQLLEDLRTRVKSLDIDSWKAFLREELEKTIDSFDPDATEKKKDYIMTKARLLKTLLAFIEKPEREEAKIKKEYNI